MKKSVSFALAAVMLALSLAGCAGEGEKTAENITVNAAVMTGPTAIGMVSLLDNAEADGVKYDFTVAGSADEITPKIVQGKFDIASVPVNLASVLYNKTNGGIRLLAVNTLGVLYIVTKGENVTSVGDLRGKTIYATGKGLTPEYTLRHILSANGIDPDRDVTIEYKSEPKEVVAIMKNAENAVAMLPQPYVTVAMGAVDGLTAALDLTDEWDRLGEKSRLITGVVIARAEFADEHPEIIASFLAEYGKSTAFANENVGEAAAILGRLGIFDSAVAEKAIPECNVVCITGDEMKAAVSGYLSMLFSENPASVGGSLPADDFYYKK